MYKFHFIFLLMLSFSIKALPNYNIDPQNKDWVLGQESNELFKDNSQHKQNSSDKGKYEPTGIAAKDSIDLGLSPKWTAVLDKVDRERTGREMYPVACFGKDCKKNNIDIELAHIGNRLKK